MNRSIDRERRKQELAEAVWQVILDKGIGAVSVRTVAEQAGLVVGSLRYIFPTRTELLTFSAELMLARATERVGGVVWDGDDAEYAFDVICALLPLDVDTRAEFEINLALIGESPAEPSLVGIRDRAHVALREAFTRLVRQLVGADVAEADVVKMARRLHALVDGLALHLLHVEPGECAWAEDLVREEISTIVTNAGRN